MTVQPLIGLGGTTVALEGRFAPAAEPVRDTNEPPPARSLPGFPDGLRGRRESAAQDGLGPGARAALEQRPVRGADLAVLVAHLHLHVGAAPPDGDVVAPVAALAQVGGGLTVAGAERVAVDAVQHQVRDVVGLARERRVVEPDHLDEGQQKPTRSGHHGGEQPTENGRRSRSAHHHGRVSSRAAKLLKAPRPRKTSVKSPMRVSGPQSKSW